MQAKVFIIMIKYWLSIIGLFLVDRLAKIYFINQSPLDYTRGDFFNLYLNQDIAFSIPLPGWLLYPLLIIILIALLYFWQKFIHQKAF